MIPKYLEICMESQQHLLDFTNFSIIREVPLVFFHLFRVSYKVRYYFWHIGLLYQGISASGQEYQDKYIWTIDCIFGHPLHVVEYTHLLYVYIWSFMLPVFYKLSQGETKGMDITFDITKAISMLYSQK